jgi:hypothetical protein
MSMQNAGHLPSGQAENNGDFLGRVPLPAQDHDLMIDLRSRRRLPACPIPLDLEPKRAADLVNIATLLAGGRHHGLDGLVAISHGLQNGVALRGCWRRSFRPWQKGVLQGSLATAHSFLTQDAL